MCFVTGKNRGPMTLRFGGGGGTTEIALNFYATYDLTPGGWGVEMLRNPDGTFSTTIAPQQTQEQETTLSISEIKAMKLPGEAAAAATFADLIMRNYEGLDPFVAGCNAEMNFEVDLLLTLDGVTRKLTLHMCTITGGMSFGESVSSSPTITSYRSKPTISTVV